jgi:conflict system STAND superfamily ATPase
LRLVSINPEHSPSSRLVSAQSLGAIEQKVFDTFVARKLIVKDFVSNEAFYQPAHEELLRWPTLSDYIEQNRIDLVVLDGLERKAELWTLGKQDLLEGPDLAHARHLELRGLVSNQLKALIEASQVSERPAFLTRATRPVVLFYGYSFLFIALPYFASLPFTRPDKATGQSELTDLGAIVMILVLVVEILLYVFVVRRRYRISRYGYYRIDGQQCDARSYVIRWLLIPAGVVLTPLTRCFDDNRLTWVDQRTRTELVKINRDGSRRYRAQAPHAS